MANKQLFMVVIVILACVGIYYYFSTQSQAGALALLNGEISISQQQNAIQQAAVAATGGNTVAQLTPSELAFYNALNAQSQAVYLTATPAAQAQFANGTIAAYEHSVTVQSGGTYPGEFAAPPAPAGKTVNFTSIIMALF